MKTRKFNLAICLVALFTCLFVTSCSCNEDKACESICPKCACCYDENCTQDGHSAKCDCVASNEAAVAKALEFANSYKKTGDVIADFEVANSYTVAGVQPDHSGKKNYIVDFTWTATKVSGVDDIVKANVKVGNDNVTCVKVNYVLNTEVSKYNLVCSASCGTALATKTLEINVPKIEYKTIAEFIAAADTDTIYAVKGWVTALSHNGDEETSFELSDSTGSIFSYEKFVVTLGSSVIVAGKYLLKDNVKQITSEIVVERNPEQNEVNPYNTQKEAITASTTFDGTVTDFVKNFDVATNCGKLIKFTNLFFVTDGDYTNVYNNTSASKKQILSTYGLDLARYTGLQNTVIYGYVRGKTDNYVTVMVAEVDGDASLNLVCNNDALVNVTKSDDSAISFPQTNVDPNTSYELKITPVGEDVEIIKVLLNDVELTVVDGVYKFTVCASDVLKVQAYNPNATDAEKVAFEKAGVVFNSTEANLLAGKTYKDVTIEWTADNASVTFDANGKVVTNNIPNGVTNVTITATLKCGDVTDTYTTTYKIIGYGTAANPLTVEQALSIAATLNKSDYSNSYFTDSKLYVSGIVKANATYNTGHSNFDSFTIISSTDATKSILIYRAWGDATVIPTAGDIIVVNAWAQNYLGTYQLSTQANGDVTFTLTPTEKTITLIGTSFTLTKDDDSSLDLSGTFTNNTEISFKVLPSQGFKVKKVELNDVEITPTEGIFSFVVKGNMTLNVTTVDSSIPDLEVYKTSSFTGSATSNTNSYIGSMTFTNDDFSTYTYGFSNNNGGWAYVKTGKKSGETTNTIKTSIIDKAVKQVSINCTALGLNDKIILTSAKVIVYSDSSYSNKVCEFDFTNSCKVGVIDVNMITNVQENGYYLIEIKINNQTTNNGPISLTKVDYYSVKEN